LVSSHEEALAMTTTPSRNGVHRPAKPRQSRPPAATGKQSPPPTEEKPFLNGFNRDASGQFAKGGPGGPGRPANPFARQLAALRRTLVSAFDEAKFRALVDKVVEKALAGDLTAAKLVFQYVVGRPAAAADPDAIDFDELQLYRRAVESTQNFQSSLFSLSPATACGMIRAAQPKMEQANLDMLSEMLTNPPPPETGLEGLI
jgi:hypothetical protein